MILFFLFAVGLSQRQSVCMVNWTVLSSACWGWWSFIASITLFILIHNFPSLLQCPSMRHHATASLTKTNIYIFIYHVFRWLYWRFLTEIHSFWEQHFSHYVIIFNTVTENHHLQCKKCYACVCARVLEIERDNS